MGFGGPVWHVSVSLPLAPAETLRRIALEQLDGVGAALEGQWEETGMAFHIRRRLSDSERKRAGGLDAVDVRGTAEYSARRAAMQRYLPPQLQHWQE